MLRYLKVFVVSAVVAAVLAGGAAGKAKPGSGGSTLPPVLIATPLNFSGTLVDKAVSLGAIVSDPTASAVSCDVTWGDGATETLSGQGSGGLYGCGAVHTYAASGVYLISVTGLDAGGVVGSSSVWIFVV